MQRMHSRLKPNRTIPRPSPPERHSSYDGVGGLSRCHCAGNPDSHDGRFRFRIALRPEPHGIPGNPAVRVRMSGRPPSTSRPACRFGSAPFAATDRSEIAASGQPEARIPRLRRHRDRGAWPTERRRDTHPRFLWATLLICCPARAQGTGEARFPPHCTIYVHFHHGLVFITIKLVNYI